MQELASTIITSAVVATISGVAINAWLESRKSIFSTKLDALKTAVALEGYAIKCADKVADHETAVSSEGHAGQFLASVPDLPELSVSVGILRPNKAAVANKLLTFPQDVCQAEQAVAFWWDIVGDFECSRNEAVMQSSRMGLKGLELAKEIRQAFTLPNRELVFGDYNVKDVLKKASKDE